jgi:FSR family fosmidomycin resistance protein-like MFS transporter
LNKPVVVSEEAPVTPVIVPDVTSDDVAKTSAVKTSAAKTAAVAGPAYIVLGGISFSHFLNDTMQSLIPSVYPIFKESYALDFAQIGLITLAFQFTASLLQPVVGHFTDRKAQPFSLAVGMGSTFFGLLLLSVAHRYGVILIAAALGLGRRCSIRSRRGSRGSLRAAVMVSHNRCFRSAAICERRWVRCLQH